MKNKDIAFCGIFAAEPQKEKGEKKQKRIIPLTDDFMKDKTVNDKVYAYLQINSYLTNDKRRFCYKDDTIAAKTIHAAISRDIKGSNGKIKKDISLSSVRNALKIYYRLGLMYDEVVTDLYGNEVEAIILTQNFNYFSYIPLPTLRYLVDTSNSNVIKVYAYLLNKFDWKHRTKEQYSFTLKELCSTIGYSDKADNTLTMRNILTSLSNNGLISYRETYFVTTNKPPIPYFKLINISLYVK